MSLTVVSRFFAILFCLGQVFVSRGFGQQTPPPIQWQGTFGGTANDVLYSIRQVSDGGYILGGRSMAAPGGTKTSPLYGNYDFWVARLDAVGNQIWDRSFGGSSFDELRNLRETPDGGFILAGTTESGVDGNKTALNQGGLRDYWVIKLNSLGNRVWERTYGGTGDETGFVVRNVPAGGYIIGGTSKSTGGGNKTAVHYGLGDFWIVRVDGNGNPLWDRSFGTAGHDELHSVEALADGGFIIGGSSAMEASGNKQSPHYGGIDFWVIRLDADGQIVWEQSYGAGSRDELFGIVQTSDGGFMLGGYSDSNPLASKTVLGFGGVDFWVVRIDGGGNKLWDRGFGGDGNDSFEDGFSMEGLADGGFLLGSGTGGYSGHGNKAAANHGGSDMWVVRLDSAGNKVWDQAFGAAENDVLNSLQQTADGGFVVAGHSSSLAGANKTAPHLGGSDYWVVKIGFGELGSGSSVDYFVAPNGQPTGTGTKDKPWDFITAISPISPIKSGDTLNMRGGVYAGNYISYLRGTSNAPVTIKPYRNERVVIDGYPAPWAYPLDVRGEWSVYQGFDVTQSSTWNSGVPTPVGIQCDAPNVKLVNLAIHDAGQGVGFWDGAVNSEIYGCIIYHNGLDNQEHGIYTQNDVGTKRIHDNIIFNNSGFGVHAYTSGSQMRGFDFQGNIIFNNGSKFQQHRNPNIFVGGYVPADRLTLISNFTFHTPGYSHYNVLLSDRNRFTNPNGSVNLQNNKFIGGTAYTGDDFLSVIFSNNLLVVDAGRLLRARPASGLTYADFGWDNNRYYGSNLTATTFNDGTNDMDFTGWKTVTGKDGNSTFAAGTPNVADVNVRPNKYVPGRANIAVYNWPLLDSVPVNLSGIGLVHGQRYEIRNAQNYIVNARHEFGPPVLVANYDTNQPIVQVPMKTAEAMAVTDPGHVGGYIPLTSFPLFGAFVVAPPSDGVPTVETPPVSHWKFDEPGGSSILDSSSGNHGVLMNGTTRVPGRSAGALEFDGVNDYATIPHHNSMNLGQNMSLSVWFKPRTQIDATTGRKDLLQKFSSYWLIFNYPYADGRLAFVLNGGSPALVTTRTVWQADRWYHVVATLNSAGMRIYVNGQLDGSAAVATQPWQTGNDLQIGGNTAQGFYFPGVIDDLRTYNLTLSASEVQSTYLQSNRDNAAPTITPLADVTTTEDTPTAHLPFTVSDDLTSPASLEVTVRSSNVSLVPPGNVVITGTGADRFLVLSPYANQHGTAEITVTVRDGFGLSVDESFFLTVTSENDPPVVSPIGDRTIIQGTGPSSVAVTVSDVETVPSSLVVTPSSSNPTLIPTGNLTVSGVGEGRTLSFQPAAGLTGWSDLTVTVTDQNAASSQATFRVTVNGSNQPPTLSAMASVEIDEDRTAGPLAFAISDLETAVGSLTVGVFSSNQLLLPNANMLLGGDGTSRNVILTPLPQKSGSTTVSLWVRDEHGASVTNTFGLSVRPVNDRPTITAIEGLAIDENSSSAVVPFTVGDLETPANDLTVTATSSNPSLIPLSGIQLAGSGANRTVQVTPAANQVGTASITLTLRDGELSATTAFLILVQAHVPVHTNLVAHWKFDELSGMQAQDSAGANPGTLLNGTTRVLGKIGYGVKLDGTTQVVNVPHSGVVSLQPPMTLSTWFKPSQLINGNSGRRDLLQKFVTFWLIFNYPSGDGKLAFVLNAGSPVVKSTTASWDAERWYHITATFGGGYMRIYVNGVLEGQTEAWGFLNVDDDYPLQFGGNSAQGVYFPGAMDDVRFYNTVLTQLEIDDLVEGGSTLNNPPTIGNIADVTMPEDGMVGPINLQVGDQETPADSLMVNVSSSNAGLFPAAGLVIGRNGDDYTLTLAPASHVSGSATITVTVTDGAAAQAVETFTVTVTSENDLPTLSPLNDRQVLEDTSGGLIAFAVGDIETPASGLIVSAESSNPSVVNPADIVLGGTGASRFVEVFPARNASGSSTITIRVTDPHGGMATEPFLFTVTAANDAPSPIALGNQVVDQDSAPTTVSFGVDDPDSLLSGVIITAVSDNQTVLPANRISLTGSGASRSLTFSPAPGQFGMARINLKLSDQDGGTNHHAVDVTVRRFNVRPTLTGLGNISTQEDLPPSSDSFSVGDEYTPLDQLSILASSSNQQLVPDANLTLTGSGAARMLTVRPLTNAFGNGTITVTVTDQDGGSTSVVLQLSVSAVNDPPSITPIADKTIEQGFATAPIPFSVSDLETAASALTMSALSSNPSVLPVGGVSFAGTGPDRTVTLTPIAGATGSSLVTLIVSDSNRTASSVLTLTVVATNTFPSISGPAAVATDEDTATPTVTFTVSDQETPVGQLVVTAVSTDEGLVPSSKILVAGTGAQRTLTMIGATNAFGSVDVTVRVADARGASVARTLTVTIRPVNDAPSVLPIANQTTGKGQATDLITFLVSDLESTADALTVTAATDNPVLVPPANITLGGSGAARTIRLTPATGESGTATVTLTVSDGVATTTSTFTWLVEDVAPPPPGVVAWWAFNEESGNVLDSHGTNTGVLSLGAQRGPGLIGGGLALDGRDDYVNVADANALDFSASMSFSLWFKPSKFLDRTSPRHDLFSKFTSYWLILNYPSQDGKITYVLNSGAPVVSTTTASWESNRWYHLVGTYDGTILKIYVNGQLEGQNTAPGSIAQTTYPFQIGGNTLQGQFVGGAMDDVMLFNRALQATEITAMFNNAGGGNTAPRISDFVNVSIEPSHSAGPLLFTVSDAETPLPALTVSATSSDPLLVPAGGLVFGSSGTNRTLTVTPAAGRTGTALIEVVVTDAAGARDRTTFVLTVATVQPLPPIQLKLARTATELELSWNAIAGRRYRIQFRNRLDTGSWAELSGEIIASGPVASQQVPRQEVTKFYRVVELP